MSNRQRSQHTAGEEIDETFIRKMLGVADRSKIFKLLKLIFDGNQKESIEQLRELINEGVEPKNFLNDLLEIIYFIQQKKNLGDVDSDLTLSESDKEMIGAVSKEVDTSTLILFWQFILKGLEEFNIVTNQLLSLEMLVIKLLHLKEMPSYEDLVNKNVFDQNEPISATNKNINKIPKEEDKINKISKDQIKSTIQTKPELSSFGSQAINAEKIKSFEDLIKLSSKKKEIELKYDLERNVNLIKFSEGKIDIAFNENLSKNFVRNLSEKLLEWTSKRWVITLTKGKGQKTYLEAQSIKAREFLENEKKSNLYKKFKDVFPDGELIDIFKKD